MSDVNITSLVSVFLFQLFGVWYHWHVMCKQNRVSGSFWSYIVADYPGKSVATLFVVAGSAYLQCVSGQADNINPQLLWSTLSQGVLGAAPIGAIVTSVTSGYALDSVINKGSKEVFLK